MKKNPQQSSTLRKMRFNISDDFEGELMDDIIEFATEDGTRLTHEQEYKRTIHQTEKILVEWLTSAKWSTYSIFYINNYPILENDVQECLELTMETEQVKLFQANNGTTHSPMSCKKETKWCKGCIIAKENLENRYDQVHNNISLLLSFVVSRK